MGYEVRFPTDAEVRGYDLERIRENIEAKRQHIAALNEAIEQTRNEIGTLEFVIRRKGELDGGSH